MNTRLFLVSWPRLMRQPMNDAKMRPAVTRIPKRAMKLFITAHASGRGALSVIWEATRRLMKWSDEPQRCEV
eukprot:scaffold14886_cov127-Isochrysis_galbana.AAC.3